MEYGIRWERWGYRWSSDKFNMKLYEFHDTGLRGIVICLSGNIIDENRRLHVCLWTFDNPIRHEQRWFADP